MYYRVYVPVTVICCAGLLYVLAEIHVQSIMIIHASFCRDVFGYHDAYFVFVFILCHVCTTECICISNSDSLCRRALRTRRNSGTILYDNSCIIVPGCIRRYCACCRFLFCFFIFYYMCTTQFLCISHTNSLCRPTLCTRINSCTIYYGNSCS